MSFVGNAFSFAAVSALVTFNGIFVILVEQMDFAGFFFFFSTRWPKHASKSPMKLKLNSFLF